MKKDIFSTNESSLLMILEAPFDSKDTIHGLSLKYGCSASSLKRINKLQKDQDLYALPHIKVPVVKHGTVHERIQKEIKNSICSNNHQTQPSPSDKYLQEFDEKLALLKDNEKTNANDFVLPADDMITTVERKQSRSYTVLIVITVVCLIVIIPITIILFIIFHHY